MGEGVGQGRGGARPEEAASCGGPKAILAAALGCGAYLFLAFSEQEDEQRLRERLPESGEAFIYAAMRRLMVRRLARS